jgi:hypothetical protein
LNNTHSKDDDFVGTLARKTEANKGDQKAVMKKLQISSIMARLPDYRNHKWSPTCVNTANVCNIMMAEITLHQEIYFIYFCYSYVIFVFAAFGPKPDEDKEPEPPEPFEYTED